MGAARGLDKGLKVLYNKATEAAVEITPIVFFGIGRFLRLLPRPKPPQIDYTSLSQALPGVAFTEGPSPLQKSGPQLRPPPATGQPQAPPPQPSLSMPTTPETVTELKRRLAKELYRVELDLQAGARIAGKACDCLTKAKHMGGLEATAEELMSYEFNPVYGKVVDWIDQHAAEFEPEEIAKKPPDYYRGLAPEVRAFRKEVMGTEGVTALLSPEERQRALEAIKREFSKSFENIGA